MRHFGYRRAAALAQMRLDAVELGPLALERADVGEVQVDAHEHDERGFAGHGAQESVRSTCRVS